MSDLAHADRIAKISSSYSEMQGPLESVNLHAAAIGMRIHASKTNVMSALIPGMHSQAILIDGELLTDMDKFMYLGSMFVANGLDTEEIRSRMHFACSAFSGLRSCLR